MSASRRASFRPADWESLTDAEIDPHAPPPSAWLAAWAADAARLLPEACRDDRTTTHMLVWRLVRAVAGLLLAACVPLIALADKSAYVMWIASVFLPLAAGFVGANSVLSSFDRAATSGAIFLTRPRRQPSLQNSCARFVRPAALALPWMACLLIAGGLPLLDMGLTLKDAAVSGARVNVSSWEPLPGSDELALARLDDTNDTYAVLRVSGSNAWFDYGYARLEDAHRFSTGYSWGGHCPVVGAQCVAWIDDDEWRAAALGAWAASAAVVVALCVLLLPLAYPVHALLYGLSVIIVQAFMLVVFVCFLLPGIFRPKSCWGDMRDLAKDLADVRGIARVWYGVGYDTEQDPEVAVVEM